MALLKANDGAGQDISSMKIRYGIANGTLRNALHSIEKATPFHFAYRTEDVAPYKNITVQPGVYTVANILDMLLSGTSLSYVQKEKYVLLSRTSLVAANITVSGQVTEAGTGAALASVNVAIAESDARTITDKEGRFSITAPDANATLIVSFIGYVSQRVPLNGRTSINIALVQEQKALEEVVLIGYQAVKKRDVIGSVSSVTAKDLNNSAVASFEQALQGRAAGVFATQTSGQPGSSVMVNIRGAGAIGSSQPLYIVDGVIGGGGTDLNPADIESIDVLKDAGTAAIYGARGANGVVIITTKRGKAGKTKVGVDSYVGTQSMIKYLDVLNTADYIAFINQSRVNAGNQPVPQFAGPNAAALQKVNTDWQRAIFRSAPIQNYNLNVSGGNENATFSLSGNYFDQKGTLINTYFKRYSLRLNSDFRAGKHLKFGESMVVNHIQSRAHSGEGNWTNPMNAALKLPPYLPVYNNDPSFPTYQPNNVGGYSGTLGWESNDLQNPLATNLAEYSNPTNQVLGNVYSEVKFIEGLTYRFNVGVNIRNNTSSNWMPNYFAGPYQSQSSPSIQKTSTKFQSLMLENTINFNRKFNQHQVSAVAGVSRQNDQFESFGISTLLPNRIVRNVNAGAGSSARTINGGNSEYRLSSAFGRVNYDFDGKYLLSATFRRDGGSRFGENRRWGNFPAFSAGWRISKEDFFQNLTSIISDLKVYGSWGRLGSDAIGDYGYYPRIIVGFNNYVTGGNGSGEVLNTGSSLGGLANPDLQWQANEITNLGVNLSLLNNRLFVSAEYYIKKSDKLLLFVPFPNTTGFGGQTLNAGAIENRGVDLQVMYQQNIGKFHFDVTGNLSTVKNKVTSLGDRKSPILGGGILPNNAVLLTRTDVGYPIGSFYGYVSTGIYQSQAEIDRSVHAANVKPGDLIYEDVNGDKVIDDKDKTYIGNPWPKLVYGLTANASWKGLDLSLFFQGVTGNDVFNMHANYFGGGYQGRYNALAKVKDAWTPQNPSATVHRMSQTDEYNYRPSSRMIEDGSFMRIKNLQLGYQLPFGFVKNAGIERIRVYAGAQNLLTITDYSGYDPEIGSYGLDNTNRGIDVGSYPQPRTFLLGVQLGF